MIRSQTVSHNNPKMYKCGLEWNTFIFDIFLSDSFSVGEDSLCSSMYEFVVGENFGVF